MDEELKLRNGYQLGKLIREERLDKKMSQEKLAQAVGLSRVHINKIENDPDTASALSFVMTCKILSVLGVQLTAMKKPDRKNIEDIEQDQLEQRKGVYPSL